MDFARGKPLESLGDSWAPDWIVDALWQAHGLNLLYGAPRTRKSTLRGYMAVCALARAPVFGRLKIGVQPQRVLIFGGEEVVEAEAARLWKVCDALKVDRKELHGRLVLFGPDSGLRLDVPAHLKELGRICRAERFDLVCIDPMINFHGANENDAGQVAAIMNRLIELCASTTVVLVHHTSKPILNGEDPRTVSHKARGSSVISGYTAVNALLTHRPYGTYLLQTEPKYAAPIPAAELSVSADGLWTYDDAYERIKRVLDAKPTLAASKVIAEAGVRKEKGLEYVRMLRGGEPPGTDLM